MRCQQCHNNIPGCHTDPQHLYRCPVGTKMCMIRMGWSRYVGQTYERGCLEPMNVYWDECIGDQNHNCYSCYGENCNNIQISAVSKLLCVKCVGDDCNKDNLPGTLCTKNDTLLGPAQCVTKYEDDGKRIAMKDCWSAVDKKLAEYQREKDQYFTCVGHMCNYQNKDSMQRCFQGKTFLDDYYPPKTVMCYEGPSGFGKRLSLLMGCYKRINVGE